MSLLTGTISTLYLCIQYIFIHSFGFAPDSLRTHHPSNWCKTTFHSLWRHKRTSTLAFEKFNLNRFLKISFMYSASLYRYLSQTFRFTLWIERNGSKFLYCNVICTLISRHYWSKHWSISLQSPWKRAPSELSSISNWNAIKLRNKMKLQWIEVPKWIHLIKLIEFAVRKCNQFSPTSNRTKRKKRSFFWFIEMHGKSYVKSIRNIKLRHCSITSNPPPHENHISRRGGKQKRYSISSKLNVAIM